MNPLFNRVSLRIYATLLVWIYKLLDAKHKIFNSSSYGWHFKKHYSFKKHFFCEYETLFIKLRYHSFFFAAYSSKFWKTYVLLNDILKKCYCLKIVSENVILIWELSQSWSQGRRICAGFQNCSKKISVNSMFDTHCVLFYKAEIRVETLL